MMQLGDAQDRADDRGQAEQPGPETTHTITQSSAKLEAVARLVSIPAGISFVQVLTNNCMQGTCLPTDRAEHHSSDEKTTDLPEKPDTSPGHLDRAECDERWEELLLFWSTSDNLVGKLIAHAKGGDQGKFQMDRSVLPNLKSSWKRMANKEHLCNNQTCKSDTRTF
jgi:hypothetical protein